MSATFASTRGIESRLIPYSLPPVVISTPTTYVRPSDWLTMPTVLDTEQKIVILCAVYPSGKNYIGLSASVTTGNYLIDWGDGAGNVAYSSASVATKLYDYNSISNTTISSRGYKQVLITITPQTGNLSFINFKPTIPANPAVGWLGTNSSSTQPFLDIIISMPNSVTNPITLGGPTNFFPLLEQVSILKLSTTTTSMLSWFNNLTSLKSVPTLFTTSAINNFTSLFNNCINLISAPAITNMAASVITASMFNNCNSLTYVPDYTFKISNASSMFSNCWSLKIAPSLDLSICTTTNLMFNSCYSLESVPNYNTSSSLTNASSMFFNCYSIAKAPFFNTVNVTNLSSMFKGCSSLTDIPLYDTGNCTNFSSMIQSCYALKQFPKLNTIKGTDFTSFAQYCYSLETIPELNTANATLMVTTFAQCYSLTSVPLLNTGNVINMSQMFYQDYNLQSVPLFNTEKVANMYQTFFSCSSLTTIPQLNTANVTQLAGTFQACTSISSFPSLTTTKVSNLNLTWYQCSALPSLNYFDSSNVINFTGAFANMQSLIEIPAINTSKGTAFASIAIGCTSLQKVPNLNTSNGVGTGSQFFTSCTSLQSIPAMDVSKFITTIDVSSNPSLTWCDMANATVNITFANCKLDKDALENIFTVGLAPVATSRTVTITNNPGVDTPISKTTTIAYSSGLQLNLNTTTGLVAGMKPISGNLVSGTTSVSGFLATNDIGLSAGFNIQVGSMAAFTTVTGTDFVANKIYYVKTFASNRMTLSNTLGGPAITVTANFTGSLRWDNEITSVVDATTVYLKNSSPTLVSASSAINFRLLNNYIATLKNWTVTG